MIESINCVAVLVAAIANMAVGTVWYSPAMFVEVWAREAKVEKKDGPGPLHFGAGFIVSLLMATVLAVMLQLTQVQTIGGGMGIAFLCWTGFMLTTHLSSVIWVGKSWVLFAIDAGCPLVALLVQGALLSWWQ